MADRFFTPDPLPPGEYVLTGAEAHHLAAVRRFAPGDRVTLFNGDGHDYPADVVAADRKRCVLAVLPGVPTARELPFALVAAVAPPKGDRLDFLVEKLTELGVTRFVPLVAARSVVVPKGDAAEKLTRAVVEASKQCGRSRLMTVDPPRKWAEFVAAPDLPAVRAVFHPGAAGGWPPPPGDAAFAVGPEGGFTPAEVESAVAAGWRAAGLGPRVLRVESAAVAAAALAALR